VVADVFCLAFRQRDRYDADRQNAPAVVVRHRHQPASAPVAAGGRAGLRDGELEGDVAWRGGVSLHRRLHRGADETGALLAAANNAVRAAFKGRPRLEFESFGGDGRIVGVDRKTDRRSVGEGQHPHVEQITDSFGLGLSRRVWGVLVLETGPALPIRFDQLRDRIRSLLPSDVVGALPRGVVRSIHTS
jgi:hypothetical protein